MLWGLLIVIALVAYWFISDRKSDKQMVRSKGGIKELYPNFISYINTTNNAVDVLNMDPNTYETGWELVRLTDRILEYKLACHEDGFLTGHFYYSVRHDFRGRVEGYFITKYGKTFDGSLIEFKRDSIEPTEEEYAKYCAAIGNKIFNSPEFKKYIDENFL